jgi:predicted DNA-binding transcriptional regulator YafY
MSPKYKPKRRNHDYERLTRKMQGRINYIEEQLRQNKYPTCKELAANFGVSEDVIQRDIRYMRDYRSMVIEVSRTPGLEGYYLIEPETRRTFNEQEIVALCIADRAIQRIPVKQRQKRLGLGLDKISKLLDTRTQRMLDDLQETVYFRPFAPEQIDIQTFLIAAEAIRNRRALRYLYLKHGAEKPDQKEVYPYCFTCAANSWYMIAWDPKNNDFRTYLLSRLSAPEVLEEKFKRKPFNLDDYLDGAFIIMRGTGKEVYDVTVEFDAWAAAYIRNRQFTRDQKIEELPNRGLRISMRLTCLEEVEAWVAYWREHAYVVSPRPLQERFYKLGQYYVCRYGHVAQNQASAG